MTTSSAFGVGCCIEFSVMPDSVLSLKSITRLRHIIGVLLAALIVLSLQACSAVKLGYHGAPEWTYWWLDGYLDLDDAQSRRLRADLAALQNWHRRHELPLYVAALEKLQALAPSDVRPAQLCALVDELRPRYQALLDQAEPTLVALAPTLSSAQLDHLARKFDKRRQKWRAEWLTGTPTERRNHRFDKQVDRYESFYGRLDQGQLDTLGAALAESIFDPERSYRALQRRQDDALLTLRRWQRGAQGEVGLRADMHALLARVIKPPANDDMGYSEQLMQDFCKTLASVHNSTTAAQRQHLLQTLAGYEADARSLQDAAR